METNSGTPATPSTPEANDVLAQVNASLGSLQQLRDNELARSALASGGDVTRVSGYDTVSATLHRLRAIDGGSGSLGRGLRAALGAHDALLKLRPDFAEAFRRRDRGAAPGAPQLVFAAMVVATWHVTTMLCAEAVRFTPVQGRQSALTISADPGAASRVAAMGAVGHLEDLVDRATRFGFSELVREGCETVEREARALNEFFPAALAALGAPAWVGAALGATGAVAKYAAALLAVLAGARWLGEYYYRMRGQLAGWLDTQSAFLQANAVALGQSPARDSQEHWAERLKRLADRVRMESLDAERSMRGETFPPTAAAPGTENSRTGGALV